MADAQQRAPRPNLPRRISHGEFAEQGGSAFPYNWCRAATHAPSPLSADSHRHVEWRATKLILDVQPCAAFDEGPDQIVRRGHSQMKSRRS